MRGALMKLFSKEQHVEILTEWEDNGDAAAAYTHRSGRAISRQLVAYWRTIFLENAGNLSGTDTKLKAQRVLRHPQPDDDIGNLDIIPDMAECILVIPDIHAPYQHPDTLAFLTEVRDKFVPDLVVNLGDELDYHSLSFHDSDPNLDSAGAELEKGKAFLAELQAEFPNVLVCHSNHGSMVFRKAKAHGIPVQMIRKYRDVIFPHNGAPGWSWAYSWKVQTPLGPVMFKHQPSTNILADAAHNACNLVVGHHHGNFSVEYCASSAHLYYGVYSGCLIDKDSMAFAYGKHGLKKPIIGCTVILNGKPMMVPMILNEDGRWINQL